MLTPLALHSGETLIFRVFGVRVLLERFHPLRRTSSSKGVICLLSEALNGSHKGRISALSATQAEIFARNAHYQNLLESKYYTNTAILLSGSFRSNNTQRPFTPVPSPEDV